MVFVSSISRMDAEVIAGLVSVVLFFVLCCRGHLRGDCDTISGARLQRGLDTCGVSSKFVLGLCVYQVRSFSSMRDLVWTSGIRCA